MLIELKTSETQGTLFESMSSPVATLAPVTLKREAFTVADTPTCPDTTLPWSQDFALGGWSARMFLHQVLASSQPLWTPLDTERLLCKWTPPILQANPERESSLLACVALPGQALIGSFRSGKMVRGLLRRAVRRGRTLRVLLRTHADTIPVTITFGSQPLDCESWTVTSGKPLLDSLADGLLVFLREHAPSSTETAAYRTKPSGSADE